MENRAEERRNTGSFAWLQSKEAEWRAFFPFFLKEREHGKPHTLLQNHTEEEEGKEREEQRREKAAQGGKKTQHRRNTVSHLIVDIKHSLLDLLIDLLGCVDESLP